MAGGALANSRATQKQKRVCYDHKINMKVRDF